MTTTVQVRIEKKLKDQAQKTFAALGMDLSSAVKLFLTQVVNDQAIPFYPNTGPKAKAIRAKWDKEVAWALKHGKGYTSTKEMFDDILK
jgi:DNA-damage-inducible protein J